MAPEGAGRTGSPQEAQTSRLGGRRHLVPTAVGLIGEQGEGRKPFTHSPVPVSSRGVGPAIQPSTERPTEWGRGSGCGAQKEAGGSVRVARGPSPTRVQGEESGQIVICPDKDSR